MEIMDRLSHKQPLNQSHSQRSQCNPYLTIPQYINELSIPGAQLYGRKGVTLPDLHPIVPDPPFYRYSITLPPLSTQYRGQHGIDATVGDEQ